MNPVLNVLFPGGAGPLHSSQLYPTAVRLQEPQVVQFPQGTIIRPSLKITLLLFMLLALFT